jgi:hypothetical protein
MVQKSLLRTLLVSVWLAPVIGLTSCNEKKQLEQTIEERRAQTDEKKQHLADVQKALALIPSPQRSAFVRPTLIPELEGQSKGLDEEIVRWKSRKEEVQKANQALQKTIDDYRARNPKA